VLVHGSELVEPMLGTLSWSNAWQEVLLFLAVAASWAGVPFIGATVAGAAAVAASQGKLNIVVVIIVGTIAGEVGGLVGYAIGNRYGRSLVDRPGKRQERRQRMMEKGEQAYARWGRLAVFFTPAIISGTAKMKHSQFALWNFIASFGFMLSIGLGAYGVGRVVTGHSSSADIAALVVGVVTGAALITLAVRHRRKKRHSSRGAADTASPQVDLGGGEAPGTA